MTAGNTANGAGAIERMCESEQAEKWLPIPGYEGMYEASDQGRVRSLDREVECKNGRTLHCAGRILRLKDRGDGYFVVSLSKGNVIDQRRVNVLVLETFVGPVPHGYHACHNNGNSTDNRLINLRYDTPSENNYDLVRHGKHHNAIKMHCVRGHEFTAENTIRPAYNPRRRKCRECGRQANRRSYAKRQALTK